MARAESSPKTAARKLELSHLQAATRLSRTSPIWRGECIMPVATTIRNCEGFSSKADGVGVVRRTGHVDKGYLRSAARPKIGTTVPWCGARRPFAGTTDGLAGQRRLATKLHAQVPHRDFEAAALTVRKKGTGSERISGMGAAFAPVRGACPLFSNCGCKKRGLAPSGFPVWERRSRRCEVPVPFFRTQT